MLPPPLKVTREQARRFVVRALGLDQPHADIASALAHHGFVQMDPINVCGRMHDLILRNRVLDYREGDLLRHLYGDDPDRTLTPSGRRAFEHYLGVLCTFPIEAWPCLAPLMRERATAVEGWGSRLNAPEERLAQRILEEIAARGPLSSDDIQHDGRAKTAWNSNARAAKTVLEKLFFHGRVLIAYRRNFRRIYDLPERVLPKEILSAPEPSPETRARWQAQVQLRQRRLAAVPRRDLPHIEDLVHPVRIDKGPVVYCLRSDLFLLEAADAEGPAPMTTMLLAPLDPLIYDRKITRRLWDFDYTWEVYTPPAKRVRGYYALPILSRHALVGHVDVRADRSNGRRLRVVSRRVRRGHATVPAVTSLARFLGLRG